MLEVHLEVWCFLVFLWVACHTVVKLLSRTFYRSAISKESFVEAVYLTYEVGSVLVAAWCRDEARVFLGFVASEQQQVGYAEKLQVEQFIFNVLYCRATADDVWLNRLRLTPWHTPLLPHPDNPRRHRRWKHWS